MWNSRRLENSPELRYIIEYMGEGTTAVYGTDSTRILQLGQYKTKVDLAADSIRRAIASGQLARGQRLRFSDLIRSLGISATPIREAVRVLEAEGLMSVDSHREVRVADFTIEDAIEIYDVRAVLEGRATQQAAVWCDGRSGCRPGGR